MLYRYTYLPPTPCAFSAHRRPGVALPWGCHALFTRQMLPSSSHFPPILLQKLTRMPTPIHFSRLPSNHRLEGLKQRAFRDIQLRSVSMEVDQHRRDPVSEFGAPPLDVHDLGIRWAFWPSE